MRVRAARIALAVVLLLLVADSGYFSWVPVRHHTIYEESIGTVLFAAAVALLVAARLQLRDAALVVLAGGTALLAASLTGHGQSSDDDYRYIWDGTVQLSGTDPYSYPPSAPELIPLRTPLLFPGRIEPCPWPLPQVVGGGCSRINRPDFRTIYPPVAEAVFALVHIMSFGGHGGQLTFEIAAALGATGVTWLLLRRALRARTPVWPVAVWAWCPVVWVEFAGNGHIDWLACLLGVLALLAYGGRRPILAGVLLGAAFASKVYPALLGASMLRRRPVAVVLAALGTVALSYLPHVLAVGTTVIGYLPTYLSDEHYDTGGRFLVFHGIPPTVAIALAVAGLAVAAGLVALRSEPDRPERSALVMLGVTFAFVAPAQGWYATLLIALVAMTGRVWPMPLALVPTFLYLIDGDFGVDAGRDALAARVAVLVAVAIAAVEYRVQLRSWVSARRSRSTRTP